MTRQKRSEFKASKPGYFTRGQATFFICRALGIDSDSISQCIYTTPEGQRIYRSLSKIFTLNNKQEIDIIPLSIENSRNFQIHGKDLHKFAINNYGVNVPEFKYNEISENDIFKELKSIISLVEREMISKDEFYNIVSRMIKLYVS